MLRSSIERVRALFDPAARCAAALLFMRDRVACVEVRRRADGWEAMAPRVETVALPLWGGRAPFDTGAVGALAAVLGRVAGNLIGRYVPVHVALADPCVHSAVLELEQLPPTRSARNDFARWRLAEALHLGDTVCASQALGADAGHQLLLAQAVDQALHRGLVDALAAAKITPWTMCPVGAHVFNQHLDHLRETNAALVIVTPDWWSLSLCDGAGRLRQVRAHWREPGDGGNVERHAEEIERSVIAYVYGAAGRRVDRLRVACADPGDPLVAALATRAPAACEITPIAGDPRDPAAPPIPGALVAIAAALGDRR